MSSYTCTLRKGGMPSKYGSFMPFVMFVFVHTTCQAHVLQASGCLAFVHCWTVALPWQYVSV